ncbi:1-(5-phosphoribosyl)-5-[(5-phosphoribosylamino)methylideneamino]imidazole-4-carboxamide isomerase [Desulfococcus sp.]|uniref:1-(5-phosphoribosyl)-5-[(5- phosphoribosylamino)methylideneamino]imidazole-4- carboxamide isomerase n=1 Tax=Desulfococcus sp. TaxID=2025834 RepID=UPI00359317BC
MIVIPAIDIKGGRCVRLEQGRMDRETVFGEDPAAMARRWAQDGAAMIHVVDLDGAVEKKPGNLASIQRILDAVTVPIQIGGGIRDMDTIRMYADIGVHRIILGTEAIRNPALVQEACTIYPGRIVVGIDARNGLVAIEGWTETTRTRAVDLARRFEDSGVAAVNFTDIHRDGMQTGPNIEATRELAESISIPVVASGGVSTLKDIQNLIPLEPFGVIGVITGKALYAGTLDLKEAIALTRRYPDEQVSSRLS